MKRRVWLILVIGSLACAAVFIVIVRWYVEPKIRKAHTGWLFTQLQELIQKADDVRDENTLNQLMSESLIDWNSCKLEGGRVFDGWGHEVQILFDEQVIVWRFQSAGADGSFDTPDDIILSAEPPTARASGRGAL